MRTYTQEDMTKCNKFANKLNIENVELRKQIKTLQETDSCSCLGWKIATLIMALYEVIHFILSR